MRRVPLTTFAVAVLVAAAVVQFTVPGAVPVLQRDPAALAAGEWWRVGSPLLVQTLGRFQVVVNLVSLAVVGALVEVRLGRGRWLLLAVAGTAAGQVSAYLQGDPGGGASIAVCGLAAGLLAIGLRTPSRADVVVVLYVAALAGWGLGGPVPAMAAAVVAGLLWTVAGRAVLAALCVAAIVLLVRGDLHGSALTGGLVMAFSGVREDRTGERARRAGDGPDRPVL